MNTTDLEQTASGGSESGDGPPRGRHRRRLWFPLAVAAGVVLLSLTGPDPKGGADGNAIDGERASPTTATVGGDMRTQEANPQALQSRQDRTTNSKLTENTLPAPRTGEGSSPSPPGSEIVLIGDLPSNRLFAVSMATLGKGRSGSHDQPEPTSLEAVGVSPVVGAPISVARAGDHLVVGTTNQGELVRLDRTLANVRTLSLKDLLGTSSELWYGSIVPIDPSTAVVSVGFGSRTALVEVDVKSWSVRHHVVFPDRYVSFPRLCNVGDRFFLLTSGTVDVLTRSFDRLASASVPDIAGMACDRRSAWVSGLGTNVVTEITSTGAVGRSLSWDGNGSSRLVYDSATDTVFGSDQRDGVVFACRPEDGCHTSAVVGRKPTDLTVAGDRILVTVEQSEAIAVLDRRTLSVVGNVAFPGTPRTLSILR